MNLLSRVVAALLLAAPAYAQTPAPVAPTRPTAPPPAAPATPTPAAPKPAAMAPATPAPATAAAPAKPAAAPAAAAAAAAATAAPTSAASKIDINSASEKDLDALFGIGPVRAKAIVNGRPYEDLNDLVKKKVLTQAIFDKAKPKMALANINTSSAAQLEKTLPGIGDVRSKAIVAGRPYASPQDLVTKGVLTQGVLDKSRDVLAW